jgi:hypothetical protein
MEKSSEIFRKQLDNVRNLLSHISVEISFSDGRSRIHICREDTTITLVEEKSMTRALYKAAVRLRKYRIELLAKQIEFAKNHFFGDLYGG